MLVSREVLNSVQKNLNFFNIDEIIDISDIEHVKETKNKRFVDDFLYWMDFENLDLNDLKQKRGVLLVNRKQINKVVNLKLFTSRIIVAEDPGILFFAIAEFFLNYEIIPKIHPSAVINPSAVLGNNIYIGPGAEIDACEIGDNCIIHSHCSIGDRTKIGNNAVIHSGAKIGFNVFSFKQNPSGNWIKYQQIAGVKIGNNVTIGSNTCINNGFITDTVIHNNSFIDSLCQIQGSVVIGSNSIIAAQSFIATNVKIGKRCWISPNVSIREDINITDDVFIGIGSVVLRSIKKSCRVFGIPAKELPTI